MRKVYNIVCNMLFFVIIVLVVGTASSTFLQRLGLFTFVEVQSNSMQAQGIDKGCVCLITSNDSYAEGDIVAFKHNGKLWLHEIIQVVDDQKVITKGQSNETSDGEIFTSDIVGKRIININFRFLTSQWFKVICICVCSVFFLLCIAKEVVEIR